MAHAVTLIEATDLDEDVAGTPIKVSEGEYIACDLVWDATDNPNGSVKWQYSKDYIPARPTSGTWRDVYKESTLVEFSTAPDGTGAGSTSETFEGLVGWVRPYWDVTADGTNATMTLTAERGYRGG